LLPPVERLGELVAQSEAFRQACATEVGAAQAVWRACLLAAPVVRTKGGPLAVRFPTGAHARWATACAATLGIAAAAVAARPEQRNRVYLDPPQARALVAALAGPAAVTPVR
jgi:hypothetical protein